MRSFDRIKTCKNVLKCEHILENAYEPKTQNQYF